MDKKNGHKESLILVQPVVGFHKNTQYMIISICSALN